MRHLLFPVLVQFVVAVFTVWAGALAQAEPSAWSAEWPATDFTKTSIADWREIKSGGPPRDGIPAIDEPQFIRARDARGLGAREPVVTVAFEGQAPRAYPIRYLMWHEIVNDTVGDVPIAVTFCPLCNSAMTFDRRVRGQVLNFGVSGKLRYSDMVMFDRQTESWWQQALGEGIVGAMTGVQLTALPTWMESWELFKECYPNGLVMAEPAFARRYGQNPYQNYDSAAQPFLYSGEDPPSGVPALMRVVRVGNRAWPLTRLAGERQVREAGVTVTWRAGQASALDTAQIAKGKDVGNIRVRDDAGRDVPHDVMFAFAFHALWPDGIWMHGD